MPFEGTVGYRRCVERIKETWPSFLAARSDELTQESRFGHAAEKVSENIVRDLLSEVLDWPKSDINYQVDRSDMLATRLGIRRLVIETKAPNMLAWNRAAADRALDQARRYADAQGVKVIAISDARIFYAADIGDGVLRDRLFVDLAAPDPPSELCWLSGHGIYRARPDGQAAGLDRIPLQNFVPTLPPPPPPSPDDRVHPTYHLPARCFAYVPDANDPRTWKLPYLLVDGSVDRRRLPKAVQAILSNYRGTTVDIPEKAVPAVLQVLAQAARRLHRMPPEAVNPASIYVQLADVLKAERKSG